MPGSPLSIRTAARRRCRIREAFDSVRANIRTFVPIHYDSDKQAMEDVRNGKLEGAVIIPPQFSRRVYEENHPRIALVVDNSDNFMSSAVEAELTRPDQRAEPAARSRRAFCSRRRSTLSSCIPTSST